MEKDTYKTDVIFRSQKNGEDVSVFALFPHIVETINGDVLCYDHIGQHGGADYKHCIKVSRPATPEEYSCLKTELENEFGYNLNVIEKQSIRKYVAIWREQYEDK